MAAGATERNVRVGEALRRAREAAGPSQTEAGAAIGISQATMNRIETGRRAATSDERQALLTFYQAPQEVRDQVDALCQLPDVTIPTGLRAPEKLVQALKAAADAHEILSFQSERIPLQLQSDQYVLLQYKLAGVEFDRTDVLRGRDERRDKFVGEGRPRYRALLAESSFRQAPGGDLTVIRQQALHSLSMIDAHPELSLQILPMPAKLPYIATDFTIFKMPDDQPDVMYEPHGASGSLTKDKQVIDACERYWHQGEQAARSVEESKKLLYELTQC